MSFFAGLLGRSESMPSPDAAATRAVLIAWSNEHGEIVSQHTMLKLGRNCMLSVTVAQRPPLDSDVHIQENGSTYAAVVLSVNPVPEGFELDLDYSSDGRRREHRTAISGAVTLENEGRTGIQAEVRNVSPGGLRLFATQPLVTQTMVRIHGSDANYLGFVRHCDAVTGGYAVGVQFSGDTRKEKDYGQN